MNLLYNISIFSLASQLISESPLVCNHHTSFTRQINIQNSYFQKYINPIYNSYGATTKFTISTSVIKNFLNQAIHVSKDIQYYDKEFYYSINTVKTPFEKIYVIKCRFISINSLFCSGGAIQSFSALEIIGSSFHRCKTIRGGGAIASYSELQMNEVDIQNCNALYSSTIFHDTYHNVNVNLDFVSCSKCQALTSNGAMTIKSHTNFSFSYSNLTYCNNDGFYCGLWIDKSNVNISFSCFMQNRNPDINGGIASIFTYSIFVDHTSFLDLKLKNRNSYGAVAIYIDKNQNRNSIISNCVFNYIDPGSSSIHIRLGAPVKIKTCCFSNSEVGERRNMQLDFQDDNVFGIECNLSSYQVKKQNIEELIQKPNTNYSTNALDLSIIYDNKIYLLYTLSPLLLAIIFSILFLVF